MKPTLLSGTRNSCISPKLPSASRHFVRASTLRLEQLCERRLDELRLVALLIDDIEFAGQLLVVAEGVGESGQKRVLGLRQGATENATVVLVQNNS